MGVMGCGGGEGEVRRECEAGVDCGLTTPRIVEVDAGLMSIYGGADALFLQSDFSGHITGLVSCAGSTKLRAGEQCSLVLTYAPPHPPRAARLDLAEVPRRARGPRWCSG